jgi:hypothetical protein
MVYETGKQRRWTEAYGGEPWRRPILTQGCSSSKEEYMAEIGQYRATTRRTTDPLSDSDRPMGYSGRAVLRREQYDVSAETRTTKREETAVAKQRRSKHLPTATDAPATIEQPFGPLLDNTVFSVRSVLIWYKHNSGKIEKAFETKWHSDLPHKLSELEFSTNLIKLTASFLPVKEFKFLVEGEFSTPRKIALKFHSCSNIVQSIYV